jgi:hypothetical protein
MHKASFAAPLDFAARGRPMIVDRAADAATDLAAQGEAPTAGIEPQMRPAVGVENDEASNEVVPFEKRVARRDLDVIDEGLEAVLIGVRAAGAAPKTVEVGVGGASFHVPG